MKNVKLDTLMCGDEFIPMHETYKVVSAINGVVVCRNMKTGRYMYMDMESEVITEGGENSEND